MSVNDLSQKQFNHLREGFLASLRVAENNNKNGVVFKNGQGPLDPSVRELIAALLENKRLPKKSKSGR